jgi:hypothetical protein
MDPSDRQIDLVDFLSKQEPGLKEYFKPEFMKGLGGGQTGTKISVNYPNDSASKYIALYGFEEFFNGLPENIQRLEFVKKGDSDFTLDIPESIGNFTNLTALHLVGCVGKLPESICKLQKLQFLSIPENRNMQKLPDCIADLPRLSVINLKGSNLNGTIPESIYKRAETDDGFHIFDK